MGIFQTCLITGDPAGLMRCLHVSVGNTTAITIDTTLGNQAATIGNQTPTTSTTSGSRGMIIAIIIIIAPTPAAGWKCLELSQSCGTLAIQGKKRPMLGRLA